MCLNLTKKKNNREGPLAREYEYFVNKVLNKDLPSQLKPVFIHYDVKANQKARKKLKDPEVLQLVKQGLTPFPYDFLDLARKAVERTDIFTCKPIDNTMLCQIRI